MMETLVPLVLLVQMGRMAQTVKGLSTTVTGNQLLPITNMTLLLMMEAHGLLRAQRRTKFQELLVRGIYLCKRVIRVTLEIQERLERTAQMERTEQMVILALV
jgi:hypothetical protein